MGHFTDVVRRIIRDDHFVSYPTYPPLKRFHDAIARMANSKAASTRVSDK